MTRRLKVLLQKDEEIRSPKYILLKEEIEPLS